ncbi:peptidase C12 ubiquitin carboxyl-terminal hydrolase 1 [Punctularia strigosozonata HHB-11173 SS5]|uniref:peptidase C12 ubiquitin carboxyl-terminal hydrolase 1 n=1 Tax=Punctularia strigosozonata (strain HHB-11173) TaxID=741275 RepID=UPI0004416350|nr:peptidase C12 ubiquitin carboxyl-terminal hydrolase 1 [Punctularia strigosozonata HHB-11173 SS5]EIN06023.1 peptidase C12 ubiquitin carboxyl-terminal hydrolase 1 [Punctularia strigosozonata HHB-11173 SS5]
MSSTDSRWIPLESNPDVMNSWAEKAGLLTSQYHFEDIYGLDEDLLAMVPQPVKAILLLFPYTDTYRAKRDAEDANENSVEVDPTILWIRQTIGNACGTIGLIHALTNSDVDFAPESPLQQFIDQCHDKTPDERAKLLETTPLFANIHAEAAATGQTAVPSNLDTDLHFICFVQAPAKAARELQHPEGSKEGGMRLIELDGHRKGPLDRGPCSDLLADVAKVVQQNFFSGESSMQFSMVALCPS